MDNAKHQNVEITVISDKAKDEIPEKQLCKEVANISSNEETLDAESQEKGIIALIDNSD